MIHTNPLDSTSRPPRHLSKRRDRRVRPPRSVRSHSNVCTQLRECDLTRSSNRAYTDTSCVRGAQADIIGAYTAHLPHRASCWPCKVATFPRAVRTVAQPACVYLRVWAIPVELSCLCGSSPHGLLAAGALFCPSIPCNTVFQIIIAKFISNGPLWLCASPSKNPHQRRYIDGPHI